MSATGRRLVTGCRRSPSNLGKSLERIESLRSKGFRTPSCRCKKCCEYVKDLVLLARRSFADQTTFHLLFAGIEVEHRIRTRLTPSADWHSLTVARTHSGRSIRHALRFRLLARLQAMNSLPLRYHRNSRSRATTTAATFRLMKMNGTASFRVVCNAEGSDACVSGIS